MSKPGNSGPGSLPENIQNFLALIPVQRRLDRQQSTTYSALKSTLAQMKRKRYLLAALLLTSPWVYRWLREKYVRSSFYQQRRKRHESFSRHLREAEEQQQRRHRDLGDDQQSDTSSVVEDGLERTKSAVDLRPPEAQGEEEQTPLTMKQIQDTSESANRKKKKMGKDFYRKLRVLLSIVIPGWRSKEAGMLLLHSGFLIARTYLSVVVARIDGSIVKNLVAGNGIEFLKGLGYWFAIALPATYTNSMIRYLQAKLSIAFRTRLTTHVHDLYLKDLLYYKMLNLDTRISGPDQLICTDIAKFADALSSLYSNLGKPVLDLIIFNYQLVKSIGGKGMIAITINYIITASLLRLATPGFGKLAAVEAKLEGDFRSAHTRIITNAEEIAFYHGDDRELGILEESYLTLIRHVNRIYRIRIFYNMFEDFIIKYSWSAVGLMVSSVPVFFPQWAGERVKREISSGEGTGSRAHGSRTQNFITNKRLMISLADAGGRIMYSYKEMAELAGYTSRVYELLHVLSDLQNQHYVRKMVAGKQQGVFSLNDLRGELSVGDRIAMRHVPIVTPAGDELVHDLSFEVTPQKHLLITGPNGVGKSAVSRVISGLWPLFSGDMTRPSEEDIMFVPQRAYLSMGTLRDQVIYPHTHKEMIAAGRTDDELMDILLKVHLDYLPDREGGFDVQKEWKDVLSGGEKQRMNLARVFYHCPRFAVLDECTSAVSTDVEGLMYTRAKDMGITLLTISHRPSLFKHHGFLLTLTGNDGKWEWSQLGSRQAQLGLEAEIKDLESKVRDEERVRKRLKEINGLLGVRVDATKK